MWILALCLVPVGLLFLGTYALTPLDPLVETHHQPKD